MFNDTDIVLAEKRLVGEKAADFIKEGMIVGLGTGSTVYYTMQKLGRMVKEGLNISAVSTSLSTSTLAKELGIPLKSLNEVSRIDITIDGADEVDYMFQGIKGGGGALLFEKIVAYYSDQNIWVIDSGKYVSKLGKFPLPVEVIPMGYIQFLKKMQENNYKCVLRKNEKDIFKTDSGNVIIDVNIEKVTDYQEFNHWLLNIPGVVETGLFLDVVDKIIMPDKNDVKILIKDKWSGERIEYMYPTHMSKISMGIRGLVVTDRFY